MFTQKSNTLLLNVILFLATLFATLLLNIPATQAGAWNVLPPYSPPASPDENCPPDVISYIWEADFDFNTTFDGLLSITITCAPNLVQSLTVTQPILCEPIGAVDIYNGQLHLDGGHLACVFPSVNALVEAQLPGYTLPSHIEYTEFIWWVDYLQTANPSTMKTHTTHSLVAHPNFDLALSSQAIFTAFDEPHETFFDYIPYKNNRATYNTNVAMRHYQGILTEGTQFTHFVDNALVGEHSCPLSDKLCGFNYQLEGDVPFTIGSAEMQGSIIDDLYIDPPVAIWVN